MSYKKDEAVYIKQRLGDAPETAHLLLQGLIQVINHSGTRFVHPGPNLQHDLHQTLVSTNS